MNSIAQALERSLFVLSHDPLSGRIYPFCLAACMKVLAASLQNNSLKYISKLTGGLARILAAECGEARTSAAANEVAFRAADAAEDDAIWIGKCASGIQIPKLFGSDASNAHCLCPV